jgi:hypothetical protein
MAARRMESSGSTKSTMHQVPKCGSARAAADARVVSKSRDSARMRLASARNAKRVR